MASIYKYLKKLEVVDYRLLVSVVFLLTFGILILSSVPNSGALSNQAKYIIMGTGALILCSYIDYHRFIYWSIPAYALSIFLLLMIIPFGVEVNGAKRWIAVAGITFQPSELSKPALVMLLTFIIIKSGRKLGALFLPLFMMGPVVLNTVLILKLTSNLSTALIVLGIGTIMIYVSSPNKKIWFWILIASVLVLFAGIYFYKEVQVAKLLPLSDLDGHYRIKRILAWLYPDSYKDLSMQSRYSMYAIAFGGILGRGLGSGTMKYFVPYVENDFVFALVVEELGIVGAVTLIFLFVYMIWRIFTVAKHAHDRMGNYLALGIGAHMGLQVILNIGVATGLLPNTGVSLPFISTGGTAILIQMAEIGIVLNISRQIPGKQIIVGDASGKQHVQQQKKLRKSA